MQNAILFNLTMEQFHTMNAYYDKRDDGYISLYSYEKYIGIVGGDSAIIYNYHSTTTNKHITMMIRELVSRKMSNANKRARVLYKRVKKAFPDVEEKYWFSTQYNAFVVYRRCDNGRAKSKIELNLYED